MSENMLSPTARRGNEIEDIEESGDENDIDEEPEVYVQQFVTAPDSRGGGQYIRPISGNRPTGILGSRNFNPQDNKRWQIFKIYKTNFSSVGQDKRNILSEYASTLNLDHKNPTIMALSLLIAYDMYVLQEKLTMETFGKHINQNISIINKDITATKADKIPEIFNKYCISIFNYLNFIIDNNSTFKTLTPPIKPILS